MVVYSVSSSSTSVFGLLSGLGWPRSKYYGIAIAIAKGMSCLFYTGRGGGGGKKKSLAKKQNNKHPCITINNNRWCQDSKLFFKNFILFFILFFIKVMDLT